MKYLRVSMVPKADPVEFMRIYDQYGQYYTAKGIYLPPTPRIYVFSSVEVYEDNSIEEGLIGYIEVSEEGSARLYDLVLGGLCDEIDFGYRFTWVKKKGAATRFTVISSILLDAVVPPDSLPKGFV